MAPRLISYRMMRKRIRRTLKYGQNNRMDHLSMPLTEAAVDYFGRHSPFDYLDMNFATRLSREACVDPYSLIVALIYLERLRKNDRQLFEISDSTDLYLGALMVAGKYLYDESNVEFIFNEEWASSSSRSIENVNKNELKILIGIDWRLLVSVEEFGDSLRTIETHLAVNSMQKRGFATYSDMRVLSKHLAEDFLLKQFLHPLLVLIGLASLAYTAAVMGCLGIIHLKTQSINLQDGIQLTQPFYIAHSTLPSSEMPIAPNFPPIYCGDETTSADIQNDLDARIEIEFNSKTRKSTKSSFFKTRHYDELNCELFRMNLANNSLHNRYIH